MIKRLVSLLLCGLIIFGICGCSSKKDENKNSNSNSIPDEITINTTVEEEIATTPETDNTLYSVNSAPIMEIIYCEQRYRAMTGTHSWTVIKPDGTAETLNADMAHPTNAKEYMSEIQFFTSSLSSPDYTTAYLNFGANPSKVTARAWEIVDSEWKNFDDGTSEVKVTKAEKASGAQYKLILKDTPHIYEVTATFKFEDGGGGVVRYCFYTGEKPMAQENENVNVYCGNTMTTVYFADNKKFTFMGGNSVTLTDILRTLKYDKPICKCLPEYTVDTEFGLEYGINLSEKYVRYNGSQAEITDEQAKQISDIIEWAKPQAE